MRLHHSTTCLFLLYVADVADEVHLLSEAGYFISRVGYVTEEKSCVNVFEFRSDIGIAEKTKRLGFSPLPSDRRLSAKLVPTFADRGCHVVSATDPHGRYLGFLDPEPLLLHSSSSSVVSTRLSEPHFRPTTSQNIW
jgi:hypothetical protein